MSIQSEITRIAGNVRDALSAIANKGVTVPSSSNSDDLASLIGQISTGSGSAVAISDAADSHGGTVRTITAVSLTGDTVTAAHLETGYTAHDALGNAITGTMSPGGQPNLQTKTNISPTTSSQTISPDAGYDGLSSVQINAMPSGTAGTPTATKGSVSNHSVSVTPSVTNTTGYITGSTKTGTAVTVSASELVSGSETKTANGTYDVTNLASVVVNVSGSSGFPLLATLSMGTISTTSTNQVNTNKSLTVSGVNDYDALLVETSVDTKTNGRHAATCAFIWLTASSAIGTKNGGAIVTGKLNYKLSSTGTMTSSQSTTAYGIYPYSISISSGTATITMYQRYNSTSTGTINGAYSARAYGLKLADIIGG